MTKKLISDRIDETHYISTGPPNINAFETDVADLIGLALDKLYEDSPFAFGDDGNLTSGRAGVSAQTIWKDSGGACGFRIWDTDDDGEVLISIDGGFLIIYENLLVADGGTGVVGETADWKIRFKLELTGENNNLPSQDILNHARMPSALDPLKYLRANAAGDEIEWASFDAATPDSCGAYDVAVDIAEAANIGDWRPVELATATGWDNTAGMVTAGPPGYITILENGVYLVTMDVGVDPFAGDFVGIGYHGGSGVGITRFERKSAENLDGGIPAGGVKDSMTASWVEAFSVSDVLYPRIQWYVDGLQGAKSFGLNRFSVTKISEE